MKKIMCEECGQKRGRRECPEFHEYICGDCCSNLQMSQDCPDDCTHIGKLNQRNINNRIGSMMESGMKVLKAHPEEALKIFDRVLKYDVNNEKCLMGKGIAYEMMNDYEKSLEYYHKCAAIKGGNEICLRIAGAYRKNGDIHKSIETLLKIKDINENCEALLLLGDCYFADERYEKAVRCMEDITGCSNSNNEFTDKANIMLSRINLALRNGNKAVEYAEKISEAYETEKQSLLENAYFMAGRMYELLKLLESIDNMGSREKYMLLQCTVVLKRNTKGRIVAMIDDILDSEDFDGDSGEKIGLIGLKIRLLFKELRMKEAYEIYLDHEEDIMEAAGRNSDCLEACFLVAFFMYSIDKKRAISIYHALTGVKFDEFMLDELYEAFSTLNIAPYIRAKAIQKSLEIMRDGKTDGFSRACIAADILFENGEYSEAYELYSIGVKSHWSDQGVSDAEVSNNKMLDTKLSYRMAICLVKQNKFEEALDIFMGILAITKYIPGVYPYIIRCCLEQNCEWMGFFKSLELEKLGFREVYELAASLLAKEHYDKAGYLLNFGLEKYKGMDIYTKKMICHNMFVVYRNLKNYHKAAEMIGMIPEKYMGEILTVDLGCIYYDMDEYEKAREAFAKAIKIRKSAVSCFNMGVIEMVSGNFENALKYFSTAESIEVAYIKEKRIPDHKEYSSLLSMIYRNSSMCYIKINRIEDALLSIGRAVNLEKCEKTNEMLTIIQKWMLNADRGIEQNIGEIKGMIDGCIACMESFTDEMRNILDNILDRVYGGNREFQIIEIPINKNIEAFLQNERRIYNKQRQSIERTEGTFQRYADNFIKSFERRVLSEMSREAAVVLDDTGTAADTYKEAEELISLGDKLFESFEFMESREYIYSSLIPYFKAVKLQAKSSIYPYYNKNISKLPVPSEPGDFKKIGIFCYKVREQMNYRIDFSYDISKCRYLFDINCHPGLREKYINFKKDNMPWGKLLWMISGIRRKWDVIDDIKSAGLMLLFYCGFENYLGIERELAGRDEIVSLAGSLIHLGNERDAIIRRMLDGAYELNYLEDASSVRKIAASCMEGLIKIRKI